MIIIISYFDVAKWLFPVWNINQIYYYYVYVYISIRKSLYEFWSDIDILFEAI